MSPKYESLLEAIALFGARFTRSDEIDPVPKEVTAHDMVEEMKNLLLRQILLVPPQHLTAGELFRANVIQMAEPVPGKPPRIVTAFEVHTDLSIRNAIADNGAVAHAVMAIALGLFVEALELREAAAEAQKAEDLKKKAADESMPAGKTVFGGPQDGADSTD